jgi:hypothetical protein
MCDVPAPDGLSDEDLDQIAARCDAASPAPWRAFYGPGIGGDDFIAVSDSDDEPDMYIKRDRQPAGVADLEFIANVRQDLPRLIAEIRRLRSEHL